MAANSAGRGGGIFCAASSVDIVNSIIWANTASAGSQIGLEYQMGLPGIVSVNFSDVAGGQAGVYDPVTNLDESEKYNADPCFASFDLNGEPNLWDFHLMSINGRWIPPVWPAGDLDGDGFVDLYDFALFAESCTRQGQDWQRTWIKTVSLTCLTCK